MHSRILFVLIFVTFICISTLFRFTNLNWDNGNRIHPDEALIVNGAQSIRWFTNLNPNFHDYNGLSVYLLSATSMLTKNSSTEDVTIVGRYLSACISTATVVLFYILAIKLFPLSIAVMTTIAFACSPLLIQLAHFYTTESILVFLLTLLLYRMHAYSIKGSLRNSIFLAIPLGLSIATKNTGFLFLPLPLLVILFSKQSINQKLVHAAVLMATTIAFFFLTSPYSFLDFFGYLSRSKYLSDVVSGNLTFDWTIQFQQTTPLYWFIQTLYAFGPLAILGPIGIVWIMKKNKPIALWTIGFMLFLSLTYLKFIRYNAPLAPMYALGFGYLFLSLYKKPIASLSLTILVVVQIIYGTMFATIYFSPHTTLQASRWIATYVPNTSNLLREDWNNILRYEKEPLIKKDLIIDSINVYTLPDKNKVDFLVDKIFTNDYIILDSPKVKNTILRLTNTYPYSSAFYILLDNGALGFIKVAEFTSYPHIGPIFINDEKSEETFTVFDHPTVRIYKKQRQLTKKELNLMITRTVSQSPDTLP